MALTAPEPEKTVARRNVVERSGRVCNLPRHNGNQREGKNAKDCGERETPNLDGRVLDNPAVRSDPAKRGDGCDEKVVTPALEGVEALEVLFCGTHIGVIIEDARNRLTRSRCKNCVFEGANFGPNPP